MKKQVLIFLAIFGTLLGIGYAVEKSERSKTASLLAANTSKPQGSLGKVAISFPFVRQGGFASNQLAVWIEDGSGNFVKTLYVTNFTARKGYRTRKESLATWVKRSNRAATAKDEIDAVSGATPRTGNLTYTWNCDDRHGNPVSAGNYRFFVEGTLFWGSNVIYSGTIAVGGTGESKVIAKAEYSSPEMKNKTMIGAVTAVYIRK